MSRGLQLPHSTRVAIAAGRKSPRYRVGYLNGAGLYVGVPEHHPSHREALTECERLGGRSRFVLEGVTYIVQEDN